MADPVDLDEKHQPACLRDGSVSREDADRIIEAVEREVKRRLLARAVTRHAASVIRQEVQRQIVRPLAGLVAGVIADDVAERRRRMRESMLAAVRRDVGEFNAMMGHKGPPDLAGGADRESRRDFARVVGVISVLAVGMLALIALWLTPGAAP